MVRCRRQIAVAALSCRGEAIWRPHSLAHASASCVVRPARTCDDSRNNHPSGCPPPRSRARDRERGAYEVLLRSVPGIGPVVALTLLADLPELIRLDRRRSAQLAGVAPLTYRSGHFRGQRLL